MTRILVVEDELKIARLVRDYLVEAGYEVLTAADGASAIGMAISEKPDLIVLDIGIPNVDGLEVTRTIRSRAGTPIVMLTARAEETDKIVGLEMGADDYVVKPFSPRELLARIRAVLRRANSTRESETLRRGLLEVRRDEHTAIYNGQEVRLTASEFELLEVFARYPDRVYTRAQLLDQLHGVAFDSYERSIDSHIKNLRKKFVKIDAGTEIVETVHGVGYKLGRHET